MEKTYFLYRHIRLDSNTPFYIGTGTKVYNKNTHLRTYFRAYTKQRKNIIWNRIISKTDYRIEILEESNDRSYIFSREKELIKLHGRISLKTGILSNITEGGDGAGGFKRSKEDCRNKSLGHISLEERERIKELYLQGMGFKPIGKKLKHCNKSVKKILKEMGLIKDKYKIMREDGLKFRSGGEAEKFMNIPEGMISTAINKNIMCRKYKWFRIDEETTEEHEEHKRLLKEGYKIEIVK